MRFCFDAVLRRACSKDRRRSWTEAQNQASVEARLAEAPVSDDQPTSMPVGAGCRSEHDSCDARIRRPTSSILVVDPPRRVFRATCISFNMLDLPLRGRETCRPRTMRTGRVGLGSRLARPIPPIKTCVRLYILERMAAKGNIDKCEKSIDFSYQSLEPARRMSP
jgi:hypothetical protein